MSFWDNTYNKKFKEYQEYVTGKRPLTPEAINNMVKAYSKQYHSIRNGELSTDEYRKSLEARYAMELRKKLTKPNTVASLFNIKNFLLGFGVFNEVTGLGDSMNDRQRGFLENPNTTDLEADIFSKLMMLNAMSNDTWNTTSMTDEDRERIKKEYKDDLYKILDKESFRKELLKAGVDVDEKSFDTQYLKYVDTLKFRLQTYGNQHLGYTEELNKSSKELRDWTQQLMEEMLNGNFSRDTETLAEYELFLNNQYLNLVSKGIQEAKLYGFPLTAKEAVAHQRAKSNPNFYFMKTPIEYEAANTEIGDEVTMETFLDMNISDLQKHNKDKLRNQEGFNANDYIYDMFNDASGGRFDGFGTDDNGRTIYKFRADEDDADDLDGLLGFNKWRKEGDFNELFYGEGGREKLEDLALTYAALKQELGEDAAKQWLLSRLQHYASEGISGSKQFENAVMGFGKDLIGDAAEIIGGAYGLVTGVAEGIGGTVASAWNGLNLGDVWTEAMGDAFDNGLTRWGALYSSTGYFLSSWLDKANEIGFSKNDNIIDPDRKDFLFKGGGSGWGYFLAETGRLASHTMFSVWSGKLLGSGFAKLGGWITKALGGSIKATKAGYRIGSTIGLALSGSNEGIMDGIQVRDDVYKQGIQRVDNEFAERAIFEALGLNVDINDNVALARFLQNNHVGDYETTDANGNTVTINNLIQTDDNNNESATLNKREMVDLLKDSEFGKLLILQYLSREDVAALYAEMKKQAEHTAIRNGAATAVIENFINGSVRSFNAGARANLKAIERETQKRMRLLAVNKAGEAAISKVGVGFALKQSWNNAKHEAIEEGLQAITQLTFTAVGNNSINRYIEHTYDTDTWIGIVQELGATMGDVVENAGAGLFNPETYEAAILGAIGSMMGFATIKRSTSGRFKGKLMPAWLGSILNIRSTIKAENEARRDMAQAITNAILKEGGLNALKSMAATSGAIRTYNQALRYRPQDLDRNNELAVEALMNNISTLLLIKDTEYGRDMMAHLAYQSEMLGQEFENTELSPEERLKQKIDRAKQFLTYLTDDEVLINKKKVALLEVRTWMQDSGMLARSIEEIAQNPTDAEAKALIDIVETALQSNQLLDLMAEINEENSRNVRGLNFVAKNALNVKSLLLQNQELRLENANKELVRIAEKKLTDDEEGTPRSNTTLSVELRLSIAVLGNSNEQRLKSKEEINKSIKESKLELKKIKARLKQVKKKYTDGKIQGNQQLEREAVQELAMLKFEEHRHKSIVKINQESIDKDKLSIWDRLRGNKHADEVAEEMRVLTAYDILTLTPHERAMMLDKKNKDKYSLEQLKEIDKARTIAKRNKATRLISQANELLTQVKYNTEEINDIILNGSHYDKLVKDSEQLFRTNVLNYRYYKDLNKDMTAKEVRQFMSQLNEDVKEGLITEQEKKQLVNQAILNERIRNQEKDENEVKVGWEKYNEVLEQHRIIGNKLSNANVVTDKVMYDDLMQFLRDDAQMTLLDFNRLTQQEKQELLDSSSKLNLQGNTERINRYIQFAADTLDLYEEVLAGERKINSDVARGTNDGGVAEETVVLQPEEEEPTEEEIANSDILLFRKSRDVTGKIGSRINRIIDFITDPTNKILSLNSPYKVTGAEVLKVVRKTATYNKPITSIELLYDMILGEIKNSDVRDAWYEIKDALEKRLRANSLDKNINGGNTYRNRLINEDRSAESSVMASAKVSDLKKEEKKKPIVDFLELHNYDAAGKYASRMSLGSTGKGMQVYYVIDPTTALNYKRELGNDYSHANNLPIFTCVEVSDNFEGGFDVKYGDKTLRVAPIGVLEDNTQLTGEVLGIAWTQAVRNTAVSQYSEAASEPILLTANNIPIASAPLNYANWVRLKGASENSGRRTLISEIKGFGELVGSAVNRIIDKLKVGKIGERDNQIYYDNEDVNFRLPIVRQAGITELQDETKGISIIKAIEDKIDWKINNSIIWNFYRIIFESDNSLKNILLNRTNLLNNLTKDNLLSLNKKVNDLLSLSFYIGNYNDLYYWKYEIDPEALKQKKFVLRAVPTNNEEAENNGLVKNVTEETINNKQVELLSFSLDEKDETYYRMLDDEGNFDFSVVHANTILLNLAQDLNGNIRTRGNEYGSDFATIQLAKGLVNHANGIFDEKKDGNLSDEEKAKKQKDSRDILGKLIAGGGLMIEGLLDTSTNQVLLQRPTIYDKDKNISNGVLYTPALGATISALSLLSTPSTVDTMEEKAGQEVSDRSNYISTKKWLNDVHNGDQRTFKDKVTMYATSLSGWISGTLKQYSKSKKDSELNSSRNEEITLNVGTNADLVFRHVLWTSRFNSNATERDSLKKIPLDDTLTGEGYYTNQELENQFGFHANQVKALALTFDRYLTQMELQRGYTFVTNVIRPKATIEVEDKDSHKKYKVPMAGELDLLAVDINGQLHPIDFKTISFNNVADQDNFRQSTLEERLSIITTKKTKFDKKDLDNYRRLVNLYQAALAQKGFNVGEGFLLFIPVAYTDDPSVTSEVRSDSEYGNSILKNADGTQYLEGLKLFEPVERNGIEVPAAELTEISVLRNDKFEVSLLDILYMAQNDVDFLRKNPELAEAINELRAKNANKITIEMPTERLRRGDSNVLIQDTGVYVEVTGRRRRGNREAQQSTTQAAQLQQQAKNLPFKETRGNYSEINSQLEMVRNTENFDENIDYVEFIVDGQSITFTVRQMDNYLANIRERALREGKTVEELYNELTVEDICNELGCRG